MEQRTILNEAQLGILRRSGRMKSVEQVHELRQIISNYYVQKATEDMDRLWIVLDTNLALIIADHDDDNLQKGTF